MVPFLPCLLEAYVTAQQATLTDCWLTTSVHVYIHTLSGGVLVLVHGWPLFNTSEG